MRAGSVARPGPNPGSGSGGTSTINRTPSGDLGTHSRSGRSAPSRCAMMRPRTACMLLAFLVMASTALCFLIVSSDRARVVRKEVTQSWHWMLLARSGRVPPASPPPRPCSSALPVGRLRLVRSRRLRSAPSQWPWASSQPLPLRWASGAGEPSSSRSPIFERRFEWSHNMFLLARRGTVLPVCVTATVPARPASIIMKSSSTAVPWYIPQVLRDVRSAQCRSCAAAAVVTERR